MNKFKPSKADLGSFHEWEEDVDYTHEERIKHPNRGKEIRKEKVSKPPRRDKTEDKS